MDKTHKKNENEDTQNQARNKKEINTTTVKALNT